MSTSKIVLRTQKTNLQGLAPLCLRITKDRKTQFIFLNFRIHKDDWDAKNMRVRKDHPNSKQLNVYLKQKIADAESRSLELETTDQAVQPQKIKNLILGRSGESFFKFFERQITLLEFNKQYGYLDKANAVYSKLKKYMNNRDLMFDDITVHWLKNYEFYLRVTLKNGTNTIHSNLKIIRKLINDAIREEILPDNKNPFKRFQLKWENVPKDYLTEEELQWLELMPVKEGSRKDVHRDMYVFSAYAAGLRISDVLQLKWKNFDGTKIILRTQKTSSDISIHLPGKALEIINKYKMEDSAPQHFIFPILANDFDCTDKKMLFRAISSATAYCNTDLKDFAKELGINKNLHFHTSRHTWATRALTKGMRIEHVSKLLTHASIKTTQIYAKIVNSELDKAMEVFN